MSNKGALVELVGIQILPLVLNQSDRDSPVPWVPGWFLHSRCPGAQGWACFRHILRSLPHFYALWLLLCGIANSPVYWGASSSSSILLKSGNAFFSNATPSDQKHIEEPFNATPSDRKHIEEPFKVKEAEPVNATKSSPEKVMVPWKIRDSSIL